jgi:hypothetical protein
MEPTLASLASAIATVVAPFTPYLVEGGKAFTKAAGDAAWKQAERIWQSIRSRFGKDDRIEGAARMVSADPEDADTVAILAKALAVQLTKHPDSLSHFVELLGGAEASQAIVARRHSLVEDVTQHIGSAGTQLVMADEGSVVRRVNQDLD